MSNLWKRNFFTKIEETTSDIPQDSQDIQEKGVHQEASSCTFKAVCRQKYTALLFVYLKLSRFIESKIMILGNHFCYPEWAAVNHSKLRYYACAVTERAETMDVQFLYPGRNDIHALKKSRTTETIEKWQVFARNLKLQMKGEGVQRQSSTIEAYRAR